MKLILILTIGLILGIIDIAPMIKKRLDNHSVLSAFIYHLIMPFVLSNISSKMPIVLTGALLYFFCCIPIVILTFKDDKKFAPIILVCSTVLGAVCGFALSIL